MRKLVLIFALLFSGQAFATCHLTTGSGIACVKNNGATHVASSSGTLSFTCTTGDLIVINERATAGSTVLPTDTVNTYHTAVANQQIGSGSAHLSIYYAYNCASGANTISFTTTGGATDIYFNVTEYSGFGSSDPLDKTANAGSTGTAPASGATATTTQAIELAVGDMGSADASTTNTAGAGWTLETANGAASTFGSEDQILSSTGTPNATWNSITSGNWASIVATFKATTATKCAACDLS